MKIRITRYTRIGDTTFEIGEILEDAIRIDGFWRTGYTWSDFFFGISEAEEIVENPIDLKD